MQKQSHSGSMTFKRLTLALAAVSVVGAVGAIAVHQNKADANAAPSSCSTAM